MRSAALLLALVLAGPAVAQDARPGVGRVEVRSATRSGALLVSVQAHSAPVDRVVRAIATDVGFAVSGFERDRRQPLVTVDLADRDLDQVLEYVLGSVGLAATTTGGEIHVGSARALDLEQLIERASAKSMAALNAFPEHDLARDARLGVAWATELRGSAAAAVEQYQLVAERWPGTTAAADAELASGRIGEALGQWREALAAYTRLSKAEYQHDHVQVAVLGIARCRVELGDPQDAIYQLQALDMRHPARGDEDRAERLLVRAKAHLGMRDYSATLADLDAIDRLRSTVPRDPAYMETTAAALEGLDLSALAARAWLGHSAMVEGEDRLPGIQFAAELLLEAGDPVGALYACRHGEGLGFGERLAPLRARVEERLGIADRPVEQSLPTAAQRLAEGLELYASEGARAAMGAIGPLVQDNEGLERSLRVELVTLWSRCIADLQDVDAAIALLSELRATFDALEDRSALDVQAAELFESAGRLEAAIDAYGGIY